MLFANGAFATIVLEIIRALYEHQTPTFPEPMIRQLSTSHSEVELDRGDIGRRAALDDAIPERDAIVVLERARDASSVLDLICMPFIVT